MSYIHRIKSGGATPPDAVIKVGDVVIHIERESGDRNRGGTMIRIDAPKHIPIENSTRKKK